MEVIVKSKSAALKRTAIKHRSLKETEEAERRTAYVHSVFEKGGSDVPFIPANAVRPGRSAGR